MKPLLFAALALGVSLTANSTTFADTHLTAPAPTYSRIPGSEKPLLRLARQDETCIENLCKAKIEQYQRTRDSADCNRASECQQSARETGECDN